MWWAVRIEGEYRNTGIQVPYHTGSSYCLPGKGTSRIASPLDSGDTRSAVVACRALGAEIETGKEWVITGFGGNPKLRASQIDVGNSGTSLRLITSVAALQEEEVVFDGDDSLRTRPLQPLLEALTGLGAKAYSLEGQRLLPG